MTDNGFPVELSFLVFSYTLTELEVQLQNMTNIPPLQSQKEAHGRTLEV